jgi:hypothetical protein
MPNPLLAASGFLLLVPAPAMPLAPLDWAHVVDGFQQQQRATVHVPRVTIRTTTVIMRAPLRPAAPPPLPRMTEKKADECVKVQELAGFAVNKSDSVDLLLRDGKMLRAKLGNDCPALGFYSGFYVKANADKKLCARRDSLRSRSGRLCAVQEFKSLKVSR